MDKERENNKQNVVEDKEINNNEIKNEKVVYGVKINLDGKEMTISADKIILATGGKSYPGTGSTGDGYRLAKELGHSITKIRPSLVPLVASKNNG